MADTEHMARKTHTTPDADWSMVDLTDDEFETFAAWVADRTPKTRRFANRDALGRFCRVVNRHDVWMWCNVGEVSHSHDRCGTLAKATRSGAVVDRAFRATGWLCEACVDVEPHNPTLAAADVAPTSGTQVCVACETEKSVRKFPTVVLHGFIRERGDECRDCCQPWRNRPASVC